MNFSWEFIFDTTGYVVKCIASYLISYHFPSGCRTGSWIFTGAGKDL